MITITVSRCDILFNDDRQPHHRGKSIYHYYMSKVFGILGTRWSTSVWPTKYFFSNILCQGNPIFTNPKAPVANSFVFNDLGQYFFPAAIHPHIAAIENKPSLPRATEPCPLNRKRSVFGFSQNPRETFSFGV